jgi:hypothetical protein
MCACMGSVTVPVCQLCPCRHVGPRCQRGASDVLKVIGDLERLGYITVFTGTRVMRFLFAVRIRPGARLVFH